MYCLSVKLAVINVFLVMAVGAFAAAEWSEKKFAHRNPENQL
jgi:uncharacterized membrane protein YgdD (TMEM256/DUF423 family)